MKLSQIEEPGLVADNLHIGIDFGTTFSAVAVNTPDGVAVLDSNAKPVLPMKASSEQLASCLLPSIVTITKSNEEDNSSSATSNFEFRVGSYVDVQDEHEPVIVESVKRLFGERSDESARASQSKINVGNIEFEPCFLASLVLRELMSRARNYLGTLPSSAVLSAPAWFNNSQRQQLRQAALMAEVPLARLVAEPTAAGYYALSNQSVEGKVLVYDLGGGTFDVSLIDYDEDIAEVIATRGDTVLGGDDIDENVMSLLVNKLKDIDITQEDCSLTNLKACSRACKEILSSSDGPQSVRIEIVVQSKKIRLKIKESLQSNSEKFITISKNELAEIAFPVFAKTKVILQQLLIETELTPQQLQGYVAVGGSSLTLGFLDKLQEFLAIEQLDAPVSTSVVQGCAKYADAIARKDPTAGMLVDVLPRSIGVVLADGSTDWILHSDMQLPAIVRKVYTTGSNTQQSMRLEVVQDASDYAASSEKVQSITTLKLADLTPTAAGEGRVEVEFAVDADGIFHIRVVDQLGKSNLFQQVEGAI